MSEYKSVLEKIRTILGMDQIVEMEEVVETQPEQVDTEQVEVKFETSTLEDGSLVYYDGELMVDTLVFGDELMTLPLEDGTYVLENGDSFDVVGGTISVYNLLVPEEDTEEVEPETEALEEVDFESKYNELLTIVEDLKSKLEMFSSNEIQMKAEIEKLSAIPEVDSITTKPMEQRELTNMEKKMNALDAIRKLRKNK